MAKILATEAANEAGGVPVVAPTKYLLGNEVTIEQYAYYFQHTEQILLAAATLTGTPLALRLFDARSSSWICNSANPRIKPPVEACGHEFSPTAANASTQIAAQRQLRGPATTLGTQQKRGNRSTGSVSCIP